MEIRGLDRWITGNPGADWNDEPEQDDLIVCESEVALTCYKAERDEDAKGWARINGVTTCPACIAATQRTAGVR